MTADSTSADDATRRDVSRLSEGLGLVPERACTCHPDDKPPQPCAKQYALAECNAMSYATALATALHAKHYPEVTQWRPLPDLLGVLTQIDNMVSGLARREAPPDYPFGGTGGGLTQCDMHDDESY